MSWDLFGGMKPSCGVMLLVAPAFLSGCETSNHISLAAKIDSVADGFLQERSVPGLAIVAMQDGNILHEGYYGFASIETAEPVDRETVFDLGSIKKHMTATAIVRLADKKKLSLDDPLRQWLPQYPSEAPEIRLRHMLHQMSGLPDEAEVSGPIQMQFEPGTSWAYSNANFDILDLVVEAADGRPFGQYLTEELTAPLKLMTLAMCSNSPSAAQSEAQGYTMRNGVPEAVEEPCWFRGNAVDLVTWMDTLMSGRVVSAEGVQEMTTPGRLRDRSEVNYGFGLDLRPYRGLRKVWHTGHSSGCTSALAYYPDRKLTIAVLANSDALYDPESIEMGVTRQILGLPEPETEDVGIDESELELLTGVFDAHSIWFRLTASEDRQRLIMTMQGPAEESWEYVRLEMVRVGRRELVAVEAPEAVRVRYHGDPSVGELPFVWVDIVGTRWRGVRL